jgi:hypothetical protein
MGKGPTTLKTTINQLVTGRYKCNVDVFSLKNPFPKDWFTKRPP